MGEIMDFKSLLEEIRQTTGLPKRKFERRHKVQMSLAHRRADPVLGKQAKDSKLLFTQGEIVWAALVQANQDLFQPGPDNLPGAVLYSTDPRMDSCPNIMLQAASELFEIKGKQLENPELQTFSDALAHETGRPVNLSVPPVLTNGIPCSFTVIEFERRHLPRGILQGQLMPILIHPSTPSIMMLPAWYWAESFDKFFEAENATEKQYAMRPEDMKPLVPEEMGGCIATDLITVQSYPVRFMYRTKPSHEMDSGWHFLSGFENDDYMENPEYHAVYHVNTIANYDKSIIPHLNTPADCAFEKLPETAEFKPVSDFSISE